MSDREAIKIFKALSKNIKEETRQFTEDFGFYFFSARRVYNDDGKMIWLVNDGDFLEGLIQYEIPMTSGTYRHHYDANHSEGAYLWHETLPPLHLSYMTEYQKVFHGITLYTDYPDRCDTMGFAFKEQHKTNMISFYARILPDLWAFKKTFFEEHAGLFQELYHQKSLIQGVIKKPYSMEHIQVHVDNEPVVIKKNQEIITLSREESLYFSLVHNGETRHDMKQFLNMSYKTLDGHLLYLSNTIDTPFYKMGLIRHKEPTLM